MHDRWINDWTPSPRWPHYTRANAGEVVPTPASPLGQQFTWERGMCQGWRDGYVRTGNYSLDEFDHDRPEAVGFFGGYMYINLSNVRMQGVRSPAVTVEQLDLAFFGNHPDVPPYTAHPADERPDLTDRILAHLGWLMTTTTWPEIDDEKAQTIAFRDGRGDLSQMSDEELLARARATQPMLAKLFESHTLSSSGSGVAPGILFAIGEAIGDPTAPMKIVAGIGEVDSAEPSYAMWNLSRTINTSPELTAAFDAGVTGLLARLCSSNSADALSFLESWDEFVHAFGSRGQNEYEVSAETWETRPELALAALNRVRHQSDDESPGTRHARQRAERERVTAEVRAKVQALDVELAGQFEAAVVAAHQLGFRERTKTNLIRIVHEERMVFRELAKRHAARGDIETPEHFFMLSDDELDAFVADSSSFKSKLAERKADWDEIWALEPPFFVVDGHLPPMPSWARRGDSKVAAAVPGDVLVGVAGCPGVVRGIARVVLDAANPDALEPGDILVAPATDPAWTPLFMSAGGVVVNVGGQISHAIIVSRELGLPCVVSVTDATVRIPDGALIEVDGNTGQVTVVEVP